MNQNKMAKLTAKYELAHLRRLNRYFMRLERIQK